MSEPAKLEHVVGRWRYLYDNVEDEFGGGFATGEFALDSEGRLHRRWAIDVFSNGVTTWRAKPWSVEEAWEHSLDQEALITFLTGRGYDLYSPTPIPVNELSAGPLERPPAPAGKPLFAAYSRSQRTR